MVAGLIMGALFAVMMGRIGRLSRRSLFTSSVTGAITCAAISGLPAWFFMPPPSTPVGNGVMALLQTVLEVQWMFWWMTAGSLIPLTLTFILGLTRSLSPVVIGLCTGSAVGLLWLSWIDYSPIPSFTGSLWRCGLGLQGLLCLGCALATSGVQRIRSPSDPLAH